MSWFNMPEETLEEKAKKEIAECMYCLSKLMKIMEINKVPFKERENNVIVKEYMNRIKKAKEELCV